MSKINLFELFIPVTLKDEGVEQGISKLKSGIGTVAKVGAAAIGAAATGLVAVGKASISAYGEYEQLAGGAKLLFDDAYGFIEERSKSAWKNVQMSQNDYLQQVNGFATGLKTALNGDEQAAAELADKILTAEADIIAATGNSQEMVQNAFNGIMKNNFTMLDNLQLGITPTKEGMQDLINQVNAWNEANGRAASYQMGNLADMQSALVDYVEMQGLAGYAANEAAETLQGSFSATRAAWDNLIAGFSNPDADLGELIDNMVASARTAFGNLLPIAERAIDGTVQFIGTAGPMIIQTLPHLVETILPAAVTAIVSLVTSLVQVLPGLCKTLIDTAVKVILSLIDTITAPGMLENVIGAALEIIVALAAGLIKAIPLLVAKIPEIIAAIVRAFSNMWPKIKATGAELVRMLGNGLISAKNFLGGKIENLINSIQGWFAKLPGKLKQIGIDLVKGLWNGISNMAGWIADKIRGFGEGVLGALKNFFGIKSPSRVMRDQVGRQLALGVAEGIDAEEDEAVKASEDMASKVLNAAKSRLDNYKVYQQMSLADEVAYWGAVREQVQEGTQARIDADAEFFKAQKAYDDAISANRQKAIELAQGYSDSFKKIGDELQTNVENLRKAYDDAVTKRADQISGFTSLFSEVKIDEKVNKLDVFANLRGQVSALRQWDETLDQLEEKLGQGSPLFEELQGMSISSLDTLKTLNELSDKELENYVDLYNQKQEIAQARATQENELLKAQTDRDINNLMENAMNQVYQLQKQYETDLGTLAEEMYTQGTYVGESLMEGISDAIAGTGTGGIRARNIANDVFSRIQQDFATRSTNAAMDFTMAAASGGQAQMWQNGQGSNQPIVIENNVNLDGKVISRQTYQYNQDEQTRRGASLINP